MRDMNHFPGRKFPGATSANIFESLAYLISPKPTEMGCKEILKTWKSRTRTSADVIHQQLGTGLVRARKQTLSF